MPKAEVPQVVISASRFEQAGSDVTASVQVIEQAQMQARQWLDIHDVAQEVANLSAPRGPARFTISGVSNSIGRDGNAGLTLRGLGGNRVLLMVDGVRLPRAYSFGSNAFGRDQLSLAHVQRIEVVRGAASALYGSDGLSGMVHFITLEPADLLPAQDDSSPAVHGRLNVGYSSENDGLHTHLALAGRGGSAGAWLLSAAAREAHATRTMGRNDTEDVLRTTANPQHDSDVSWLAKWVVQPSPGVKHALSLEAVDKHSTVELLSSRSEKPLTGTPAQIAGAILAEGAARDTRRLRAAWDSHFRAEAPWADEIRAHLAYQDSQAVQTGYSDRNTLPDRTRETHYGERAWQAGLQFRKLVSQRSDEVWVLNYGFDGVSADLRNLYTGTGPMPPEVFPLKRFPDTRDSSYALYAQAEWTRQRWSFTPGLRWQQFDLRVLTQDGFSPPSKTPGQSLCGSAVSPKLGLTYRPGGAWTWFANYAEGFKAPTPNQVNGYFENAAEKIAIVSNPQLKPETSRTVEIGLRHRDARLTLEATAFEGRFENLIAENRLIGGSGTADDPKRFQTVNIDQARIRGFEAHGRYTLMEKENAQAKLRGYFSYAVAQGRNLTAQAPLNSIDPAQAMLGLEYAGPTWEVRLDAYHRGAKTGRDINSPDLVKAPNIQVTLPESLTFDLHAQWRLRPRLRLSMALTNLTNQKYWLWPDVQGLAAHSPALDAYSLPGRSWRLSLGADF